MKETLRHHQGNRNTDPQVAAFTLTDLLAVLGALALLVCVALPSLARPQGQVKIAQCADNLRQLCLGIQLYAHDNSGRLASNSGGVWLWDTQRSAIDPLQQGGVRRNNFYCPALPAQNTDGLWNYSSNFRVIGYALTLPGSPSLLSTNANPTLLTEPLTFLSSILPIEPGALRVLVADATISQPGQNNTPAKLTYQYTGIQGGFSLPHRSPHLEGRFPAGGNAGMLDGHVEWRSFQIMVSRTQGNNAGFWW